jgi:hypothetical protein
VPAGQRQIHTRCRTCQHGDACLPYRIFALDTHRVQNVSYTMTGYKRAVKTVWQTTHKQCACA